MLHLKGHGRIIKIRNRAVRIPEVMQRNLDPFSHICTQDQRFRSIFPRQYKIHIFQWNKDQSIRIMIAIAVVDKFCLYCRHFVPSYHIVPARTRRQRHDHIFSFAERLQALLISVISPDYPPEPQPGIINPAEIIQVISWLICLFDINIKCLRNDGRL